MVAATPAKLRADGIAQRLVPPVALTQTAIRYVIVVMAQSQGLKPVMMETPPLSMGAATPAKLRLGGTVKQLGLRVALTQTAIRYVTRVVMAQSQGLKPVMMETPPHSMGAATPAKLRLGGTVKQLGLRVALTQTAI